MNLHSHRPFSFCPFLTLALSIFLALASMAQEPPGKLVPSPKAIWGEWQNWGDQGDGTYRNPVLPADFSDLDCIQVGPDYYAISSTFQFSPGVVILHSRNLVNWDIVSHAVSDLTQISPELNWDRMNRPGKGIWAGAIRYHDGRFWIFFGAPNEGYFMTTSHNITGPWEPLHPVLREAGWDDCCPFWDDDGQGYLVGTNFRDGYKIHLWKLTLDGRDLVRDSDHLIHQSKGSEANKLYKFHGAYYHLFSEVRSEGRVVMMERSTNVFGPYDQSRQLNHGDRPAREPNQGGIVQAPNGDWFWFTHHGSGDWAGRYASLLPVTWQDGWPIIGQPGADGIGTMVWSGKIPAPAAGRTSPPAADDFSGTSLPPQWEWNYQPRADKWSLSERPGWLRLHAFRPLAPANLLKAGNTLSQRSFRTAANLVVVKLDLRGMADGQQAGLCHFSKTYGALGILQDGAQRWLISVNQGVVTRGPVITADTIWLNSSWGLDGQSQFAFSLDGKNYSAFGEPYTLAWGNYRGDRIGLYTFNDLAENGCVDFASFHYSPRASLGGRSPNAK